MTNLVQCEAFLIFYGLLLHHFDVLRLIARMFKTQFLWSYWWMQPFVHKLFLRLNFPAVVVENRHWGNYWSNANHFHMCQVEPLLRKSKNLIGCSFFVTKILLPVHTSVELPPPLYRCEMNGRLTSLCELTAQLSRWHFSICISHEKKNN